MIKGIVNKWLKWSEEPYLKLYRGYGDKNEVVIYGHLFKGLSIAREKPSRFFWKNAKEMIKRFVVSPWEEQEVELSINGNTTKVLTKNTGYFTITLSGTFEPGWTPCKARFNNDNFDKSVDGEVLILDDPDEIVVSDIDDTILISHATNMLKKLFLLLSRNPQQRKPFEGIAKTYMEHRTVPFFYVSSSEWNLYDFILSFCEYHKFPKGVYLLQDIKLWRDLLQSGAGDHDHKYDKIDSILGFYKNSKLRLVGDSGQKDPALYLRLAGKHTNRIASVHIRDVRKSRRIQTRSMLSEIEDLGIKTELFVTSLDFTI